MRLTRLGVVAATILFGVILGAIIASQFGKGLRPGPVQLVETVGRIEILRLPTKARRLSDIRTFIIQMDGADDYGRVFVNNYLWMNNENPQQLFYSSNDTKERRDEFNQLAVDRNELLVVKRDARVLLRSGTNDIVVELENSILGTCVTAIDIVVNGEELESFPRSIPDRLNVEAEVVNRTLLRQFKKAERSDVHSELSEAERNKFSASEISDLSVSSLDDVICARRIFQFEVE